MSLFKELKRRNVIRVAAAYLIIGWLLAQISTTLEDALNLPPWFDTLVVTLMLIGFPIALIIAWIYELTPDGIKKEKDIQSDGSITSHTGKKLDYITIVAAIAVAGMFAWQQMSPKELDSLVRENGKIITEKNPIIPVQAGTSSSKPENPIETLPNNKSIAVLPFTNMANNPESEPITVGLHDDLLSHVSKISALKVISRTSVLRYKDTQKSIGEIAKELGVAHILEGGVQKSGNQIRINVQLIDAQTDEYIWAEIFDRELTANNIFKIQTEISKKIAEALKTQLLPHEQQSLMKQATDNLDAYSAYLAGRQRMLNRNSKDLKQALELFQKASDLDSNYALAYIGQADTISLLNEYSDLSLQEMFSRSEPLIAKALEIDPLLAEVHTSKAGFLHRKGKINEAEHSYKYSITLNPNYATTYHWYGRLLRNNFGRYEEALILSRKAAELDPLSPVIQTNVGWSLERLGRNQDALAQFQRVIELAPKYSDSNEGIAGIYRLTGEFGQAINWQKKAIEIDKGNIRHRIKLVMIYLDLGDIDAAEVVFSQIKIHFPNNYNINMLQAFLYLAKDQLNEFFLEAKQLYQQDKRKISGQELYYYSLILTGDYQKAENLLISMLGNNKESGKLSVNTYNLHSAMDLVWIFDKLKKKQKAESLMAQIQNTLLVMPQQDIRWSNMLFKAITNKPKEAAKAYNSLISDGKYIFWWAIQSKPYLKEVKKQPEYIQAHKKLMENLAQQRKNLAKLEAKDREQGQTL